MLLVCCSLSLALQQDALTFPMALLAIETCHLTLTGMKKESGPRLQAFLDELDGELYRGVELKGVREATRVVFNT